MVASGRPVAVSHTITFLSLEPVIRYKPGLSSNSFSLSFSAFLDAIAPSTEGDDEEEDDSDDEDDETPSEEPDI